MDPNVRLRIATHLHFALLRLCGEDVEVGDLLRGGDTAREAFWVCEASGDAELAHLAGRLRAALEAEAAGRRRALRVAAPAREDTPQNAAWARHTSGFGVSLPPPPEAPVASGSSGWFAAVPWLRKKPAGRPPPR